MVPRLRARDCSQRQLHRYRMKQHKIRAAQACAFFMFQGYCPAMLMVAMVHGGGGAMQLCAMTGNLVSSGKSSSNSL